MTSTRLTELTAIFATGKRSEVIAAGAELIEAVQALQKKQFDRKSKEYERRSSVAPTLAQVMEYAHELGLKEGEAENFFDHYEMVGWVYGKSRHPIKKWKAAMNKWHRQNVCPGNGDGSKSAIDHFRL